ncbi:atrial natriuretic peptide receptor 2-like [Paroedura picta]|uniref:atrial natriuretic peptide receptor 2-like n=1 Tax=Paroedura picta TaxID=143630 RepID=UPI0040567B60
MASLPLFLQALTLLPSAAPAQSEVTVGVVVPERDLRYFWAWPRVAPALELALEALEPQLSRAGLNVTIAFAPTAEDGGCSWPLALENIWKLKRSRDPDVLLGLGCDFTEIAVSDWAQRWGLPFLLAGEVYEPFELATAVYAGPGGSEELAALVEHLNGHFNWTSHIVGAVSSQVTDFQRYFRWLRDPFGWLRSSDYFIELDAGLDEALRSIRAKGRVVFINGSPEMVQQMMRLAQAQNMTNGDYVFIYLDPLGGSLEAAGHCETAKPWQSKEGLDSGGLQEAFQTVLIVTFHQPQTPEYQRFQSELILRAQRDFGVSLNDSRHKNLVAGCFHDGLLLYIRALIETLHEGGSKRNTSLILEKMRSLTIQGVTGTVSIDEHNKREADFYLWSMADLQSGQYQVVAHYNRSMGQIDWHGPIHWKKGVPLSNPPCVFSRNDPSCDKGDKVAYIHGSPEMVQQMMRLAQAQHMTNGDYVFIYLDLLGESLEAVGHREAAKPWQSKESPDSAGLREAFQTVLIITFHQPQTPEYRRFQSELILRAQRDFGVSLNDSLYKNLVAGCFHDGLLLYIRALIETLHEGGSKRNTSLILEKMRSLEIQGVTGTVSIDEFNEREADFDLWSMADMQSGQYQVVGRYVGTMKQIVWLGPIHWKQGAPPLDDPPCVFSMDYPSCSSEQDGAFLHTPLTPGVLGSQFTGPDIALVLVLLHRCFYSAFPLSHPGRPYGSFTICRGAEVP